MSAPSRYVYHASGLVLRLSFDEVHALDDLEKTAAACFAVVGMNSGLQIAEVERLIATSKGERDDH